MSVTTLRAGLLAATASCAFLSLTPAARAADDTTTTTPPSITLPEVRVYGSSPIPTRTVIDPATDLVYPAADGADLLDGIPGVSTGRMGGHGIEPYIRGQSQTRLNVIDDGAFIHGGCPNRMDPPTAYLSAPDVDRLIVDKGYASVTNGPGGPGGTVRTERKLPVFMDGKNYTGSLDAGLVSNAWTRSAAGDVAVGTDRGYVRGDGFYEYAQDYRDGSNQTVRSAFSTHGGRFEAGLTPMNGDVFRIGVQADRIEDALFAGAGMDSPLSDTVVLRGNLGHNLAPGGLFSRVEASAYGGAVHHIMDNYSLRSAGATVMKVDSNSNTYGGRVLLKGGSGATQFQIGSDVQINDRDAVRFMGTRGQVNGDDETRIQSFTWPDINLSQVGLFAEAERTLAPGHVLRAGLRYDRVDVSADKADRVAINPGQSANTLYQTYYGVRADDRSENNFGGLLRYELTLSDNYKVFAGVSRSVRTADATERGIAQNNNTASNRWIGRPDIAPEKHYQVDVGGTATFADWSIGGTVYYDHVVDFILRDKARGQDGILLSDNASVYHNVNATLTGFELSGQYRLDDQWSVNGQASFTYGQNEEDDRPLAQIPPLQMSAAIERTAKDWMAGLRMRAAYRQPRADVAVDNNSGLDVRKTPGYAVFDLYGKVFALKSLTVTFGITNLLDHTYANHLSRSNSFDPTVVQVNEPGRSYFLRAHATF